MCTRKGYVYKGYFRDNRTISAKDRMGKDVCYLDVESALPRGGEAPKGSTVLRLISYAIWVHYVVRQ